MGFSAHPAVTDRSIRLSLARLILTDEKTVVVATAKNHSFANLLENPNAVYIRMEQFLDSPKTGKMKPGSSVMNWKRIRVYMRMKKYATSGKILEVIQKQATDLIGEETTKMLHAAVIFETYEVRPLVDFGRGGRGTPSKFS